MIINNNMMIINNNRDGRTMDCRSNRTNSRDWKANNTRQWRTSRNRISLSTHLHCHSKRATIWPTRASFKPNPIFNPKEDHVKQAPCLIKFASLQALCWRAEKNNDNNNIIIIIIIIILLFLFFLLKTLS